MKLTKKEIIIRFNKLIAEGKVFEGKLSELMEAYKVDRVGKFAKYNYLCSICGEMVSENDLFLDCRLKGTSHKWKNTRPIHLKCLEEV